MAQRMSNCFDCFHLSVDLFVPNFSFIVFAMSSHAFRASLFSSRSKFTAHNLINIFSSPFVHLAYTRRSSTEEDDELGPLSSTTMQRSSAKGLLGSQLLPLQDYKLLCGDMNTGNIPRYHREKRGNCDGLKIVHGKEKAPTETNLARLMFCSTAID